MLFFGGSLEGVFYRVAWYTPCHILLESVACIIQRLLVLLLGLSA